MSDCWDSDPDLVLPPGPFSLSLPLASNGDVSEAETETESSSGGASALFSGNGEGVEWGDEDDAAVGSAGGDAFVGNNWAAMGVRTKEEEDQSSTDSRNGTIQALMSSFSGLSIASPTKLSDNDDATPSTPVPRSTSPQVSQTSTLRLSSTLASLLASANSGPGRVTHLGSTPQGQAKSVLGDWDEDLELDLPAELPRPLRGKSSFASHISDDPEDEYLERGLPTPRTVRKASLASSGSKKGSHEADMEEFDESEFDLPTTMAHVTLSPLLSRPSFTSLALYNRTSSSATLHPPPSHLHPPPRTASPTLSMGDTSAEDDDEAFFEELVLPSYFLGGPGAMTPPSDSESRFGGKVDLQAMLKRKLEARGRGEEESRVQEKGKGESLDGYRERHEERGGEHGLEIEVGIKLGVERMRTRSGPQPPSLKIRKGTTPDFSQSTPTRLRRLPLPSRTHTAVPLHRPPPSTPTASTPRFPSTSRPPTTVGLGRPPTRPSSAAGAVDRTTSRRAGGPPPAPSTALRDRVRTRTVNLRPRASSSSLADLAGSPSTPVPLRVPPRFDTSGVTGLSPIASPAPMTPSTPSSSSLAGSARTLRGKNSHGNLLATPTTGSRTLEKKRSLQNLTSLVPQTPTLGRRPLRSPTPGSSLPPWPMPPSTPRAGRTTPNPSTSSFAAPTASSSSRIRERVISGPTAPTPMDRLAHLAHPPRPSSAIGGTRLQQPTLASKAKVAQRPAAPLVVLRLKRARTYGDGSELDAFDDLPTSRERESARASPLKGRASVGGKKGEGTIKASETIRARGMRRSDSGSTIKARSGGRVVNKRALDGEDGEGKRLKETPVVGGKKRGLRKEPQLIRNLGPIGVAKGSFLSPSRFPETWLTTERYSSRRHDLEPDSPPLGRQRVGPPRFRQRPFQLHPPRPHHTPLHRLSRAPRLPFPPLGPTPRHLSRQRQSRRIDDV